jgi:hypothetical protein
MSVLKDTFMKKCVPTRSALAVAIAVTPPEYMKYWMIPAGMATIGNIYRQATYDENQTGGFGQNVWWNSTRIIHTIILLIFIILIATGEYNYAKILPVIDLIIGVGIVSNHYAV